MGESAQNTYLLNRNGLGKREIADAVIVALKKQGDRTAAAAEIEELDEIGGDIIIFHNPGARWTTLFADAPSADDGFIQTLSDLTGTPVMNIMLFDGDILRLSVAANGETFEFSRGSYGDDWPEDANFPDHVWESLLAPDQTLENVRRELDKLSAYEASLENGADNTGEYYGATALLFGLGHCIGLDSKLLITDYEHLDELEEEMLEGYEIVEIG